jgi:hypothetical protein
MPGKWMVINLTISASIIYNNTKKQEILEIWCELAFYYMIAHK